ncbi:response regulator transcription factor [Lentibacillus saliphilus]|uniref:response regulator transcription factor n=1 Tax=Lentibacillus saliphilus TaxID=2737028 RepID=UPI001C30BAF2|nr:response regulator [Lentibacillus saliphilus]
MYRILIIEDEEVIREGLKYMVDWVKMDCVVVGEACNGEEGLEQIESLVPDIVLLDVNMPIMNGIDMLAAYNGTQTFCTIILSGYNDFAYAKKALEYEVIDYLLKPIDHKELYKAVHRAKDVLEIKTAYKAIEAQILTKENVNVYDTNLLGRINKTSQHVTQMLQYVQENYHDKITINDLVEEIGMSATYLNKKFKQETGFSFNDFLNRYRIQKAIQMISTGNEKISMVALEVGYSQYQYFVKVFKKYTNMLPSDYVDLRWHS